VPPDLADHLFDAIRVGPHDRPDDGAREADALFSEHLEGLCRELRVAIAYGEHRFSIELAQLFVQGAGADIPGITDHLASTLGIPVKALCPAEAVEVHSALSCGPSLMTVVGLAMHPVEHGGDQCMQ
jgi:Tfp pilus assembly PilM family ATPase